MCEGAKRTANKCAYFTVWDEELCTEHVKWYQLLDEQVCRDQGGGAEFDGEEIFTNCDGEEMCGYEVGVDKVLIGALVRPATTGESCATYVLEVNLRPAGTSQQRALKCKGYKWAERQSSASMCMLSKWTKTNVWHALDRCKGKAYNWQGESVLVANLCRVSRFGIDRLSFQRPVLEL
ncbi:unnamed protein product [Soboliphyme baturini]|uniref:SRCR domain-containing protein n=1 Tax=Soboliphyme baturini TaxID=241478 RepID=A0A183IM04_9BILA|nr:unnamed protein product [Soboliphyme baturini]